MTQPVITTTMKATRVRYVVLGLTVAAYMITYMDRVVISVGRAGDPERIRILAGHHGLDSGELPLGLRAVPDSRRMAGRPHRAAPRADADRHLVERLHVARRRWRGAPLR